MQSPLASFPVGGARRIGATRSIACALLFAEPIARMALLPSPALVSCWVLLVPTIAHRFTLPIGSLFLSVPSPEHSRAATPSLLNRQARDRGHGRFEHGRRHCGCPGWAVVERRSPRI